MLVCRWAFPSAHALAGGMPNRTRPQSHCPPADSCVHQYSLSLSVVYRPPCGCRGCTGTSPATPPPPRTPHVYIPSLRHNFHVSCAPSSSLLTSASFGLVFHCVAAAVCRRCCCEVAPPRHLSCSLDPHPPPVPSSIPWLADRVVVTNGHPFLCVARSCGVVNVVSLPPSLPHTHHTHTHAHLPLSRPCSSRAHPCVCVRFLFWTVARLPSRRLRRSSLWGVVTGFPLSRRCVPYVSATRERVYLARRVPPGVLVAETCPIRASPLAWCGGLTGCRSRENQKKRTCAR